MAHATVVVGNLASTLRHKVERRERNACERCCDQIPFLVCPCSHVGLLDLLSGNIHTYVLSTFTILGVCGLFYSSIFGWSLPMMYCMLVIAFVGPLWVTCTIAPKAQLSWLKSGVIGEIEALQHTNRALRKKLQKYRKNLHTLRRATSTVAKESKLRRWTAKKSSGISKRLKEEDEKIADHVVKFQKSVKNIQRKVKSLPKTITDFEKRVEVYLTTQMTLDFTDEGMADDQKDIEEFIKELKNIPRSLEASVGEIKYFKEYWENAGDYAKEIFPVIDKIQVEKKRIAGLVRQQELSFCRMLAYNIRERSDFHRFGIQEYIIFVERLPTYLADVLLANNLKFKKYTRRRMTLKRSRTSHNGGRTLGQAGLRRLIEDIVDGVEMIDQLPDQDTIANIKRDASEAMESKIAKMRRNWSRRSWTGRSWSMRSFMKA